MATITQISRTVSGDNYDNITLTATLKPDEDPQGVAKRLDFECQKYLGILKQGANNFEQEKTEAISILKRALEFAENEQLPF